MPTLAPRLSLRTALLVALLAPAAAAAQESATLHVRVVSAEAPVAPIESARVGFAVNGRSGLTGPGGAVVLAGLRPGADTVIVTGLGRRATRLPVHLFPGETRELSVALPVEAVALAEVEARGQPDRRRSPALQEFYGRVARNSGGHFVTREQIDKWELRRFTDLFRGMSGVQVTNGPGGLMVHMPRNVAGLTDRDCPPTYYVDGIRFEVSAALDREFKLEDIEGVEVYAGSSVPGRYGGNRARCGVILVWTRDRI